MNYPLTRLKTPLKGPVRRLANFIMQRHTRFPGCLRHQSTSRMASVQRVSTIDDDSLVKETALNGDYPETTATIDLSDNSSITRMEDMLRVATDLQENTSPLGTNRGPQHSSYTDTRSSTSGSSLVGEGKGTAVLQSNTAAKMDNLKKWSISTYKCTRQLLSEKFGKGSRTVDEELESQVAVLKETQKKYLSILRLSKQLTQQFSVMLQTQRNLGDAFSDLGLKTPDLHDEFNYNAETQKTLARNGEVLLGALNFFTANLQTLCSKTIEDTMATVKAYDAARVEFDAYRSDHQYYNQATPTSSAAAFRADEAKKEFEKQKARFDRIRNDLTIKLKFLEENKVKVMQRQLLLFHNATTAYFSGNKQALENTMKEFHVKMANKDGAGQSFLEQK